MIISANIDLHFKHNLMYAHSGMLIEFIQLESNLTDHFSDISPGLNFKKKLDKPSRASYRNFYWPWNIFASPDINDNSFEIVTSVDIIASVDNMKRIQCIVVNWVELSSRYAEPKVGYIIF